MDRSTDPDALWAVNSGGLRNHNAGPDLPMGSGKCEGERGVPLGTLCGELCKTSEPIEMPFGLWNLWAARMGYMGVYRC